MPQIIPRTAAFEARYNTRMKFLLGNDVTIGAQYHGWETVDGYSSASPCRVIDYDGRYLYVHTVGTNTVTLFAGDMADYKVLLLP